MDKYFALYLFVFVLTLFTTVVIENRLIPKLSECAKQPIYEDGPSWHKSKQGTPTMGGVAFLLSISVSLSLSALFLIYHGEMRFGYSLLLTVGYSAANSAVGIIDDVTKLRRKENAGLSPTQKLALQFLLAAIFLFVRYLLFGAETKIELGDISIELGWLYYPIAVIILLGAVNCANLTDGIDGLAGSVAFSIGTVLLFISAFTYRDVATVSSAMIGGTLGFLFYNINPAKVFMGDTGSLFLGAIACSCVFALRNPFLIVLIGGVYVIEGISVIMQVLYFKLTRKRIFKMAPLHHHLEKCGYNETKICMIAILATLLLSIPAFIIFGI